MSGWGLAWFGVVVWWWSPRSVHDWAWEDFATGPIFYSLCTGPGAVAQLHCPKDAPVSDYCSNYHKTHLGISPHFICSLMPPSGHI